MRPIPTPTWTALGAIGRSPVSKLSILMPFIGYLILLQDKVISVIAPLEGSGAALDVKLSIGFYLLYFGLFIFGVASFFYHVACPEVVRRFHSSDEYVERIQPYVTASDLKAKLIVIIERAGAESEIGKEASLYHSSISAGLDTQLHTAVRNFTLRAFFEKLDTSLGWVRWAVLLLFVAGLTLTAVPSFIALVNVMEDFMKYYL